MDFRSNGALDTATSRAATIWPHWDRYFQHRRIQLPKKPNASLERPHAQGLAFQMGVRLQNRRLQLGLHKAAVAAHLGIPPTIYEQYELGEAQVPATALADLGELLKVPL